jgi:hypothetical protein
VTNELSAAVWMHVASAVMMELLHLVYAACLHKAHLNQFQLAEAPRRAVQSHGNKTLCSTSAVAEFCLVGVAGSASGGCRASRMDW